jgi:DNA-directed RNA polymerase subunit RPC12/RpoP
MKTSKCLRCKKDFKNGEEIFVTRGRRGKTSKYFCKECVKKMEY